MSQFLIIETQIAKKCHIIKRDWIYNVNSKVKLSNSEEYQAFISLNLSELRPESEKSHGIETIKILKSFSKFK